MSNIKETIETKLTFGNEPKKLGFEYLQNRLKSDTKSTEQEIPQSKKRRLYQVNNSVSEIKLNPSQQIQN